MPVDPLLNIKACVFDAYGTLFDVASAARRCKDELGDQVDQVSAIWRVKQLEYSWLRSLMGRYVPFSQVTAEALDYAMDAAGIDNQELRTRLLRLYLELDPYAEVRATLVRLKEAGVKTAILSNGSPDMLNPVVKAAHLTDLLDAVYSVHDVGVYKVDPKVYQMAVDGLKLSPEKICFMSSNAWDAHGAAAFGFRVVWINRFGQRRERIPEPPEVELESLTPLPDLLGV